MTRFAVFLSVLITLCFAAVVHCQASSEPRTALANMHIVGDADRGNLEDPTIEKSYDQIRYSFYSLIQLKDVTTIDHPKAGVPTVTDYFPQGTRGIEYREACFQEAWPEFYRLAKQDPQSEYTLLSHLTIPEGKPLLQTKQLIHNCIIFKDLPCAKTNSCPKITITKSVVSKSYNHKVYQNLRWKSHWDVFSIGKYFGPRNLRV